MLGLSLDCEKGFHPYFYDLNYVGDIVDKKYFNVCRMTFEEKVDFDKWYDSYENKEYNFSAEIKRYCCNDVKILHCCVEFYKQPKKLCAVNLSLMVH